jgi:ubiquinone/menaquinone biosynthesis C-methylase UbiE
MTVTGVDLSRDMLALCRERLKGLNTHAYRLIQGDMTSVVTEETYDAVIIPYSSFSTRESSETPADPAAYQGHAASRGDRLH